jgi:hypothetical protein
MRHVTHINPVPGPFSFSARSQPERRARSRYPKDHRHNTDERTSASRHSLNNQCELKGSGVVAGQRGFANSAGQLLSMPTSGSEEKLLRCPAPYVSFLQRQFRNS